MPIYTLFLTALHLTAAQWEPLYTQVNAPYAIEQAPRSELEKKVIETQLTTWALIKNESAQCYVDISKIKIPHLQSHHVFFETNIVIRQKPDLNSSVRTEWPANTTFSVLRREGAWTLLKNGDYSGWVPTSEIKTDLLRVNFKNDSEFQSLIPLADELESLDGQIHTVLLVDADKIITLKNQILPFSKIKRIISASKAETTHSTSCHESMSQDSRVVATLFKGQRVKFVQLLNAEWKMSLYGTQAYWWKSDRKDSHSFIQPSKIEDLFKRGLYDMASHPQNKYIKVASARGVFVTYDDKNWKELPQFKNQNVPLSFSPDGVLFIGSNMSIDNGETFRAYLKWDEITRQLQAIKKDSVRGLKIINVDASQYPLELKITLTSVSGVKFDFVSADTGSSWKLQTTERQGSQNLLSRELSPLEIIKPL